MKFNFTIPNPRNENWDKMTPNEIGRFCSTKYYKIYLIILFTISFFSCKTVNINEHKIEKIETDESQKTKYRMGSFSKCILEDVPIFEKFYLTNPQEIRSRYGNKQIIFDFYSPDIVFGDDCYFLFKNNEFYSIDNDINKIAPDFPGGSRKFCNFFSSQLKRLKKTDLKKKISVYFEIEKDGSLTSVEINGSYNNKAVQDEIIRVLKLSPQWKPGKYNGEKIKMKCRFDIVAIIK